MTPKILLVEDDETLGFLLGEFLRSRDFEVTWAKDGVDGLRQFNADHFDLCLLDVMMPALDGFTVAELLRQRQADLPIISSPPSRFMRTWCAVSKPVPTTTSKNR